ncbi:MAG: PD-(D/E)XK nuclease family protein [Candidatus Bruticola sp.]
MSIIYQTIQNFIDFVTTHPQASIIVQDKQYLAFFTSQLSKHYLKKKTAAWRCPNIYTIDVWSSKLWNWLQIHSQDLNIQLPKLIDPVSEKLILDRLVHTWNDTNKHKFLNPEGTSISVYKCWRLLCQYNCLPELPEYAESFKPQFISNNQLKGGLKIGTFLSGDLNSDHLFFLDIVKKYCLDMKQNGTLSGRLLPNALIHFIKLLKQEYPSIEIPYLNKEMVFANFIENTYPQLDSVLNSLIQIGIEAQKLNFKNPPLEKLTLIGSRKDESLHSPFESLEEEIAWAVNYIKPKLADPNYSAAIVAQNLDENFYLTLDKYANPHVLFTGSNCQKIYKSSGGTPLSKTPMSVDFFSLLQLATKGKIKRTPLLNLIQNGFLYKAKAEFSKRSCLYKSICSDWRSEYTLKDIYELAKENKCFYLAELVFLTYKYNPNTYEDMRREFREFRTKVKNIRKNRQSCELKVAFGYSQIAPPDQVPSQEYNKKFTLAQWINYSRTLLQMWISYNHAMGKAPTVALSAATYLSKLRSFYTLSSYTSQSDVIDCDDFLRYLRLGIHGVRLVSGALSPEAERFQILNIRKTLRSHFSEIILVGFNTENFPQPVSYPGFIPQSRLVELGWPQAHISLSLQETLKNLEALRHCADRVIVSFSNSINKNDKQQPSSVGLENLIHESLSQPDSPDTKLRINLVQPEELINHLDATAQPDILARYSLAPLENRETLLSKPRKEQSPPPAHFNNQRDGIKCFRGGVQVISDMANCPLQALLIRRLECAGYEEETKNGLDTKLDRGNLLHECLKRFWEKFNSRAEPNQGSSFQQLNKLYNKKLSEGPSADGDFKDELELKLRDIVEKVLEDPKYKRLSKHILENERDLLTEKLYNWMVDYERQRGEFDVTKCEEKVLLNIAPQSSGKLASPNLQLTCAGIIDRIDEVKDQNGNTGKVIIDYKTGNPDNSKVEAWDPNQNYSRNPLRRNFQLPLYAFESEEKDQCLGICFALINKAKANKGKFADDTVEQNLLGETKKGKKGKDALTLPWPQFRDDCCKLFSKLAQEYLEGSCRRTDNLALCQECTFVNLCCPNSSAQDNGSAD